MTDILSSISGYFSKSLILGTFLPVVIFMVLGVLFLAPQVPVTVPLLAPLAGVEKEWPVVLFSFVAIVLSGFIYNLNIPILRLYEGYPWKDSWIGRRLIQRHKRRFDAAQNRINAMRACRSLMESTSRNLASHQWVKEFFEDWKALGSPFRVPGASEFPWLERTQTSPPQFASPPELSSPPGLIANTGQDQWDAITGELIDEYSAHRRAIKANYPDNRSLILPTRLGNVIRSFEYYPGREYQIDSIVLWPRLVGIIPKEYAVIVDEAKTTFDFMMNCSMLSLLMSFLILLTGLIYTAQRAATTPSLLWLSKIAIFAALSYFFYRLSIDRVGAWGLLVKSSFDLYRWELLKKLGYQQEPETREDERRLWGEISRQMIYGDRFDKNLQGYAKTAGPSYPARSETKKAKLEFTRGMKSSVHNNLVTIYLRVKNTQPNVDETNVIVSDKLSEDFDYEWGSARIGNVEVPVSGANPYYFEVGELRSLSSVTLTYNAIRKEPPA